MMSRSSGARTRSMRFRYGERELAVQEEGSEAKPVGVVPRDSGRRLDSKRGGRRTRAHSPSLRELRRQLRKEAKQRRIGLRVHPEVVLGSGRPSSRAMTRSTPRRGTEPAAMDRDREGHSRNGEEERHHGRRRERPGHRGDDLGAEPAYLADPCGSGEDREENRAHPQRQNGSRAAEASPAVAAEELVRPQAGQDGRDQVGQEPRLARIAGWGVETAARGPTRRLRQERK